MEYNSPNMPATNNSKKIIFATILILVGSLLLPVYIVATSLQHNRQEVVHDGITKYQWNDTALYQPLQSIFTPVLIICLAILILGIILLIHTITRKNLV